MIPAEQPHKIEDDHIYYRTLVIKRLQQSYENSIIYVKDVSLNYSVLTFVVYTEIAFASVIGLFQKKNF